MIGNNQDPTSSGERDPAAKGEFYLPEDFGLDPTNKDDARLYTESEGDKVLFVHLWSKREMERRVNNGDLDRDKYVAFRDDVDRYIAARRREIGLDPPDA